MTKVRTVNQTAIDEAAALLKAGAVVAFPTETVYGLGANGLDRDAVLGIFAAKGRPADNPLIQHVADPTGLDALVHTVPPAARALAEAFWPGPLTLVLPARDLVPLEARGGLPTVGVRCPAHPWARRLIAACGFPIAAPSANRSGRPSPTTAQAVLEDMDGRIPLILDGGPCAVGLESTVVGFPDGMPVVLRPGGVTPAQIEAVAGAVRVDDAVLHQLAEGAVAASPGMKYRHYAPQARVTVVDGPMEGKTRRICALYDAALTAGGNPAILAASANAGRYGSRAVYSMGQDDADQAAALFETLRRLDTDGRTDAFAEALEPSGLGLAVMNRLLRAAGFRILHGEDAP